MKQIVEAIVICEHGQIHITWSLSCIYVPLPAEWQYIKHLRTQLESTKFFCVDKRHSQQMQMMGVKRSNMRAMATLQELKGMLHSTTILTTTSSQKTLSDIKYSTGFEIMVRGSDYYQQFVFPQLSQLLAPLLDLKDRISVLKVRPRPKSVLGGLPNY